MKRINLRAVCLLALLFPASAEASEPVYPLIRVLSRDDGLFVQQQSELDDFRRLTVPRGTDAIVYPPLSIFEYGKRKSDDLFALNARLGIRYDTLATLNGTTAKPSFDALQRILIPTQEGLFVSNPPRGWLEEMMLATRLADGKKPLSLLLTRAGKREAVYYFPGESFTKIERGYFLGILLRLPLERIRITSMYGWRSNPFTGSREFHDGIDLGAAEGTEVYAVRDGVVDELGTNATLGHFIVLSHEGGLQTVYGHLSSVRVTIKEQVHAGTVIGAVGHTGYATGPHLHFEVRERGSTTDPIPLLAVRKP